MHVICECESEGCVQGIDLNEDQVQAKGRLILIVETCPRGPEPMDVLVRECDGYSLYQ